MLQDVNYCSSQAIERYKIEKDMAAFIKKEFDKNHRASLKALLFGTWIKKQRQERHLARNPYGNRYNLKKKYRLISSAGLKDIIESCRCTKDINEGLPAKDFSRYDSTTNV
ncbi:DYL2-like protein [Mya arenaria]|uniref:DYL2-like protein n=1 Tax=Mya arenaria TaxID=6604 RepID=A0ABY7FDJ0_MYAAR|nr:DYL2-like protein [Mya arenaria]